jgi:flavin-dependent dehydrogenase
VRTHVVCRKKFDQGVVRQAIEAGAHLWLLSKPTDAIATDDYMQLVVDRNGTDVELTCDLLVGADGAHSWTRRKFRMGRPKELMVGFQADVTGISENKNWLEMYTGKDVAPGLFAWVIPADKGNHRIGVWAKAEQLDGRSVEDLYDALLAHPKWKERFSGLKEISRYCGPIPCGIIPRPYKNRVMVIGDAAGMAKPTTGGGIGPGFRQVEAIIEKLATAIKNNRLSEKDLSKICKPYRVMRKEQARARALRDLLVSLPSDEELDKHFKLFNQPDILELINEVGDIENPVSLGMNLLKKVPEFRKLAIKAGIKILFA